MRFIDLDRLAVAFARALVSLLAVTFPRTLVSLLALAFVPPIGAQEIARESYIRHLPPTPSIVSQARASAEFRLYGHTDAADYVDRSPVDGIDDRRATLLLGIAERFSPILRRNTFLVPRDIWWVAGGAPWLQIDRWVDTDLVGTDSVRMDSARVLAGRHGASGDPATLAPRQSFDTANDARLEALIRELDPERLIPAAAPAGGRATTILFFDTPGSGERSWQQEYRPRGSAGSRIYAHFFIHEERDGADERRYMLAVQYIFFYPFNDGGNNHEGDWEHINVLIGTRASVTGPGVTEARAGYLPAAAIESILDARTPIDSLAIAVVDYYFHHLTLRVHYQTALTEGHDDRPTPVPETATGFWEDHDFERSVIDRRVHAYGGALATHPIGYIGGNNRGPDELLHVWPLFLRSYNRNSGATYPFPGTWQTIGPAKATETVSGRVLPTIVHDPARPREVGEPIVIPDDRWVTYRAADIELLPDWERLLPLVRSDPLVRRHWAWFVLPARWGWPATRSPGGGVVARTDLGHLAPYGPTFKIWWNRVGEDPEHLDFDLRALRTPMSPRVPWSVVQSGWGFLNYPLLASQLYPFYNVIGAHLSPAGLPLADRVGIPVRKTFVAGGLERIATIGIGASRAAGGDGYARALLQVSDDPRIVARRHDDAQHRAERMEIVTDTWRRFNLDLHIGKSVFIENSFSAGDAAVRYSAEHEGVDATLDGRLAMRQLTGGMRAGLPWPATESSRIFARLGYGWTWYKANDLRLDGAGIDGEFKGGYTPTFIPGRRSWPNMAYSGLTFEYFGPRESWLFNRMGYGFRIDGALMIQRLPSHERAAAHDLWMGRSELAVGVTVGW